MEQHDGERAIRRLAAFIGEWRMQATFKDTPAIHAGASVVFEWLPGERFLIERWEVPVARGARRHRDHRCRSRTPGNYLQHYFDSRGVARVYKMSFNDGIWKLWRDTPDFSPLDFPQRYAGSLSEDGNTISGAWEICHDGATWEHDFDLTYTRLR